MCRLNPVRSSSAGFTLIELMVALVISGIVAGVVFDLMLGQTRFARYQNAREEVQQNARAALEVISAELRGVPPEAIITAGANNIQFRLPRAWGILCTDIIDPATTTVSVRFPVGVFPADMPTSSPIPSNWGIAVLVPGAAPVPPAPPPPPSWQFVTGISPPTNVNCDATLQASVPAAQGDDRAFTGPAVGVTARRGALVFVWQEVGYDLNTSNLPGNWIRRNTQANPANPQPMAGPVPAVTGPNAGLQFSYFDVNGDPTGNINAIARIGVSVTTESQAKFKDTPQTQTARTEIYLRNRN